MCDMYSGEIEITSEVLQETDKLVQLLESPIFTCKKNKIVIVHLSLYLSSPQITTPFSSPVSQPHSNTVWFTNATPTDSSL